MTLPEHPSIAVVGLGYVGLPLAVALADKFKVVGFDVDAQRVQELRDGWDRTREVSEQDLGQAPMVLTAEPAGMTGCDVFIVTVPTPVDHDNRPDLRAVIAASRAVGEVMSAGAVVVYESTVYPGVTEDLCGSILSEVSGLTPGADFFLGYSPERINPGDTRHSLAKIVKVVAGQTPEVTDYLGEIYSRVIEAGVFRAASIKTAEAAKVIENAQRDINIAFVNEVTKIFNRLDLSIHDVLDAARTKWNFLDFRPGMVGGHCIGVDPYYLAHCSEALGLHPQVILAGRRTNDSMGTYFAGMVAEALRGRSGRRILVLGLTFKENVPDLRNSKVVDLISALGQRGFQVSVHDPLADPQEALEDYGLEMLAELEAQAPFDCVVGAVAHQPYRDLAKQDFEALLVSDGLIFDLKNIWAEIELPAGRQRRTI